MAAYAEGLNILENADAGKDEREADAETAPLEHPEYYQYDLDIPEVAEVWRRGSVIGSWLLDLTAAALQESPDLADFAGRVSDSGEGRWTSIAAIDEGVPAPVLTDARSTRASPRAASTTSPTRCCRRCASSSAATTRSRAERGGARARGRRRREAAARRGAELIAAAAADGGRRARGASRSRSAAATRRGAMFELLGRPRRRCPGR